MCLLAYILEYVFLRVQRQCLEVAALMMECFWACVCQNAKAAGLAVRFALQVAAQQAQGWGKGNMTMVGDAAHSMRPTGAYGIFALGVKRRGKAVVAGVASV